MISRRLLMTNAAVALMALRAGHSRAAEVFAVTYSDAEWRKRLTGHQFAVLRRSATEHPFTSPLLHEKRQGNYACAGCDLDLFSSETKFESGTGWPSFWAPLENAIGTTEDRLFWMVRTEVHCRRCGRHLGHVFDAGPEPTGLRYCINGVALSFRPTSSDAHPPSS
ncbi:MAG TPA: peptide-methionine (R)-S-oxide reductase MsrB [Alphaproteobacteria bacterium]